MKVKSFIVIFITTIVSDLDKQTVCQFEGNKHFLGEEFFPNNSCSRCVCDEQFDGNINGPSCRKLVCNSQITFGQQIKDYCAPFYKNTLTEKCCPDEMICCKCFGQFSSL